ncbi:hypothetical protein [Pararhodonellum marinum]|uniref:hypothetical protein n=1 Tax=Pararhodonellum marinum TaxID=2755358 RepID=UPI001E56F26E|nr:hypothetical protein [Pararhodonellum marinum]
MKPIYHLIVFCLVLGMFNPNSTVAQSDLGQRSTLYFTYGRSGAVLREFNELLADRNRGPLTNGYSNFGLGYQNRFNDFIVGVEIFQNSGRSYDYDQYRIDYRTSRLLLNIGYSFTEEGRFQLIHYMSVGAGFINFEMMKDANNQSMVDFLQNPAQGYILRKRNIHKGSQFYGGFLTEIGFQMGYDIYVPGMEESIALMAKFGYSFSPFERAWDINGVSFDNLQSGAFLRVGAGISLPDHNFFYKDATIGVHLTYSLHYTRPEQLNSFLESYGYAPFIGRPNNWGLKVLGNSKQMLYGLDIFNVAHRGNARFNYEHTLNSIRFYGNYGLKFFQRKNLELGALGGLGYGNLRYSLLAINKLNFPELMDDPDFDGYLRTGGLMFKPEAFIGYAMPLSKKNNLSLVYSVHAGYEFPIGNYTLADLNMSKFMAGPYLQFGLGIRP